MINTRATFSSISKTISKHKLAILCAFIVAFIYIGPHLFFMSSLGDNYRGIPLMNTANEDYYLARMQEIIDGHYMTGSFMFYEFKDHQSLTLPVSEFFYTLPSLALGISPVASLMVNRFILSFVFFLVVYFLVYGLCSKYGNLSSKISAIGASFLVVLAYDIVNYHRMWNFFVGKEDIAEAFVLWSRPINPIMGAIFLFSFLLIIWNIINNTRQKNFTIIGAGLVLAFSILSYFFSWGTGLSILGVLFIFCFIKKEFFVIKSFIWVIVSTLIFSVPYFYFSYLASQSEWYRESILRSGLFYTHYPMLNKFLIITLFIYLLILLVQYCFCGMRKLENWHYFILSMILGSIVSFNQQIITGITIWPEHFVQYSIPICMITMIVVWHNVIKKYSSFIWFIGSIFTIFVALWFGISSQVVAYQKSYSYYGNLQQVRDVFDWVNDREKDSVILVLEEDSIEWNINGLIPAFTHCNIYIENGISTLIPFDRIYHNLLSLIRLKGTGSDDIEQYVLENEPELKKYLFSNWKETYNYQKFPDFKSTVMHDRIKKLPEDYTEFIKKDFYEELKKYKIDYVLIKGPNNIDNRVLDLLPNLKIEKEFEIQNIRIYSF